LHIINLSEPSDTEKKIKGPTCCTLLS